MPAHRVGSFRTANGGAGADVRGREGGFRFPECGPGCSEPYLSCHGEKEDARQDVADDGAAGGAHERQHKAQVRELLWGVRVGAPGCEADMG